MPARVTALLLMLAWSLPGVADESSRKGHGHISAELQIIKADGFEASFGKIDLGKIDTQTLNVAIHYNLTDRVSVSVGLPLIRKRYRGSFIHDPLALDPPRPDVPFLDDGKYRTDFQDWHFGLQHRA